MKYAMKITDLALGNARTRGASTKSPHTTTETRPGFFTFDLIQMTAEIAPPALKSAADVA
jgi:hypothetical protein